MRVVSAFIKDTLEGSHVRTQQEDDHVKVGFDQTPDLPAL